MNSIKTAIVLVFILSVFNTKTNAQCSGGSNAGSISPTGCYQTTSVDNGDYKTFSATAGSVYVFTMCSGGGGISGSWDPKITIRTTGDAYANGYNDDFCGNLPQLVWTAPSTATYRVLVSRYRNSGDPCNHSGSQSGTLAYKVCAAPSITTQPSNSTICSGATASFSVGTSCNGSNTFQWQVKVGAGSFTNLSNGANVSGATTTALSLTSVTVGMSTNQYRCIVTNDLCSNTSTSNAATLTVNPQPLTTASPSSQTICSGSPITNIVLGTSNGISGTTYSWTRNNTASVTGISSSGTTDISGTLINTTSSAVTVTFTINSNGGGCSGTTATSTVVVNANASISTQPGSQSICAGANATFTVAATGTGLTYQWQDNSSGSMANISGATNATLNQNAVTNGMNGRQYRCVVTGTCNSVTSNIGTLTVNPLPTVSINSAPLSASYCGSGSVSLTASGATGYTWSPGGSSSASITASPLATTLYTVTGTTNGCSSQATQTVTVHPSLTVSTTATSNTLCDGQGTSLDAKAGNTSNYTLSSVTYNLISGTGTQAVTGDDNVSSAITLPFQFNFYGVQYDKVYVYSNGFIQFGTSSSSTTVYGQTLPSATAPNAIIAGVFSDLNANANTITYFTSGTSPNRKFVVYYNNVPFYCTGSTGGCSGNKRGSVTFQIQLSESSNVVEVHIGNVTNNSNTSGASKVCGIENANGTLALVPALRNGSSPDWTFSTPEAYRFKPSGGTLTYAWSPATFLSSTSISNPNAVAMNSTQNYSVIVTDENGCVANSSQAITVNPLPTVSITPSGLTSFCPGGNVTLTATSGLSYSWNTVPVQSTQSIIVNSTGNYSVTASDANCSRTVSMSALRFDTLSPTITVIGNSNLCTGQTTADLQATGAVSYVWNTTATSDLITVNTAGSYSVIATDANGCVTHNHQSITETTPPTNPNIINNGQLILCSDGVNTTSVNLQATNYPAASLIWSNGDAGVDNITVNYEDNFFALVVDANGCVGTSSVLATSVRDYPVSAASATSNDSTICSGSNAMLSANGGNLIGDDVFKWYQGSCNGVSVGTGNSISVNPSSNEMYYVRAEGSCGVTACKNVMIQVYSSGPGGTVQPLSAPLASCQGNVVNVSVPNVSNTEYYSWSAPSGTLINGQVSPAITTGNNINLTLGSTTSSGYNICVFAANPCGNSSNTKCTFIRGVVSTPQPVSGNSVVCANSNQSYSVQPVVGADGYFWTVPNNSHIISGQGTNNITVDFEPSYAGGNISVYAYLNCGYNSPARVLNLISNPGVPTVVNGLSSVCPGNVQTFSVPLVNGAAFYNWSLPAGASIVNGSGTNTIDVSFSGSYTGGNICVTSVSGCGVTSSSRCKALTTQKPSVPNTISGQANGVCGSIFNYSVSSVAGATSYNWTVPVGATIMSGQGTTNISVSYNSSLTSGLVGVSSVNSCASSNARTLLVRGIPAVPGSIAGNGSVCVSSLEMYDMPIVAGATNYTWSVPSGSVIEAGQGSSSILVTWGATGGNVICTPSNQCGNSNSRTFAVNVSCRTSQLTNHTETKNLVSVYPNPTRDIANVEWTSNSENYAVITITDITGQVIYTEQVASVAGNNHYELNLSDYAEGIYLVQLVNDNEKTISRIVKE